MDGGQAIVRGRRHRAWSGVLAVAVLVGALGLPSPAAAAVTGSIVFTKDHDVWVMAADDPSTARAVTTDGTEASPYLSPTQDDDGRILVIAGGEGGNIVRMDQQGALLGEPFRPPAGNLVDLDLRADGEIFSYTHYGSYDAGGGFTVSAPSLSFAYADGRDSSDIESSAFDETYANFYAGADETVLTSFDDDSNATIATLAPGETEPQDWFRPCDAAEGNAAEFFFCSPSFAHITAGQDRLVVAVPGNSQGGPDLARLWVFDMPGPVPAEPTWGCELRSPARPDEFVEAESEFYSPEWSPDGSALVYQYYEAPNNSGLPLGIYIASGFDSGCEDAFANAELVVPDGNYPDWSAAPLGASPGPDPGPTPDPTPNPSPDPTPDPSPDPTEEPTGPPSDEPGAGFDGNPSTTERINNTGPVAIAMNISQERFGDAGAARVVLSRDDRFPDSLAGASLTSDGPLLFTPTDALHGLTANEIARVLPPGGTVHLLGGVGAISEAVADEIEAAGFVVDRLAGASRMETAIAVADRVRQLVPDVERVAVARAFGPGGDDSAAWADSVTGGGWAAAAGVPILVTDSAALHPAVEEWLAADAPSQTTLFGGEAALSAAVEGAVPAPQRVAGAERTETAGRIATELWGTSTTGERRFVIINGFREDGWAYGLAAGGMAAQAGAPLLMVGDDVPAATAALVTGCTEVDLVLVGSGNVISNPVGVRLDALDQEGC